MQAGEGSSSYLREMAKKCRLLPGELDGRAAASLRKPAQEYEEPANAAEQRDELQWNQRRKEMTTR